jgi:threonylcarbamoyladenosine tRNA methylthiotransferase MtaB
LHVFPFSPRPGTPAARMPQVPRDICKARAARLREAGEAAFDRFLGHQVGATRAVLVEKPGFGHSEHFAPVRMSGGNPGAVVPVRITGAEVKALKGEIIKEAA